MKHLRRLTFTALLLSAGALAQADTLDMSGTGAIGDSGGPSRGMTQQSVQAKYGEPRSTRAPVGDPPITRWEYQDFVVYFEYDKVIHAVRKR